MNTLQTRLTEKIGTAPKKGFISAILVASTLIWGFFSIHLLTSAAENGGLSNNQLIFLRSINLISIVSSALLGTFFIYKVRRRIFFLKYWMLGAILISLVPSVLNITDFVSSLAYFTSVGIYFGTSLPVCFGYFAASTEIENRSRLGGIIFLISFVGIFLSSVVDFAEIAFSSLFLAFSETLALGIIVASKPEEKEIFQNDFVGYKQIFRDRSFLLYLVPWVMFTVVDFMALPLVSRIFPEYFIIVEMSGTLLAGILASVFGFVSDRIGRKRLVLLGFALLGLGYGSLSLLQGSSLGLWGWCFFAAVDGLSWGIFCTVFIMTIWGDLSHGKSSEKYYAVGFLPFFLSSVIPRTDTFILDNVPFKDVFSFASIFLFVAVLPLAYAPETLNLKNRELKSYLEKALKKRPGTDLVN